MLHIPTGLEPVPHTNVAFFLLKLWDYMCPLFLSPHLCTNENELLVNVQTRGPRVRIELTVSADTRYMYQAYYQEHKVQHITSYHTRLIFSYCYLAVAHQAISSPFVVSGLRRKPLATQLVISIRLPEIAHKRIRTFISPLAEERTSDYAI